MKVSFVVLAAAAAVLAQDSVSATGAACEPHDDHWHCPPGVQEPTTPPGAAPTEALVVVSSLSAAAAPAESCEPHGDHWHCPDGVPEPTTPPPAEAATTAAPTASESHDEHEHEHEHEATATTCEPHGDHYHCPSGVAEPTTPPPASGATSAPAATSASNATASASPSASPSQFDGAAAGISATSGSFIAVIMGAVGAFFL